MKPVVRLVLTCEHAVNAVPPELADVFQGAEDVLASHRGWDAGALEMTRRWQQRWNVPLFLPKVSRLVCDANRSPSNAAVWSAYTRRLPSAQKAAILARWHSPLRREVESAIARLGATGATVLHLSLHSFTPVFAGIRRTMDMGLLYDPGRPGERLLAARWQAALKRLAPLLRVRRNAPYRGCADGMTTALRRRFPLPPDGTFTYLGLEVECNQALLPHFPVEEGALALEQALAAL